MKPAITQGKLDGLCGLYSVINSLVYLGYTNDEMVCRKLFKKLVNHTYESFPSALYDGVKIDTVLSWLQEAIRITKMNVEFERPFKYTRFKDRDAYLEKINPIINDPKTAIIVGFGKPYFHWTVIRNIRRDKLYLYDSYGFSTISLHNLVIKKTTDTRTVHLATNETIIIRRG